MSFVETYGQRRWDFRLSKTEIRQWSTDRSSVRLERDRSVGQGQTRVKSLIGYHVSLGMQCQSCPYFGPDLCTDKQRGHHLGVSAYHDLIQACRQEADREAFRDAHQSWP
jgi:hypothetical protein